LMKRDQDFKKRKNGYRWYIALCRTHVGVLLHLNTVAAHATLLRANTM